VSVAALSVIASEAKQSRAATTVLDCFVATLRARTVAEGGELFLSGAKAQMQKAAGFAGGLSCE
jgi:hypothetical protein